VTPMEDALGDASGIKKAFRAEGVCECFRG